MTHEALVAAANVTLQEYGLTASVDATDVGAHPTLVVRGVVTTETPTPMLTATLLANLPIARVVYEPDPVDATE